MPVEDRHESWLQAHVADWESAGLISASQSDAILHFEHADEPVAPQRLTVVAEVACYLGSVIAFAGGAAIIGPNWGDLGLLGQGAIALSIAIIGFVVGSWVMRQGETGTERLGGFLWVIGTGGVALAVGGVVDEIDPVDAAWFPFTIGIAVLAIGTGLWRNLERPLQLLTAGVGVILAGGGLVALTDLSMWIVAPIVAAVRRFGIGRGVRHRPPTSRRAGHRRDRPHGRLVPVHGGERALRGAIAAVVLGRCHRRIRARRPDRGPSWPSA